MKPLITLAARLYPSPWRKRYSAEFLALLEDVNPGWRELFDVLGGALKMQLTTGATYLKLGAAFALAGVLIATVASFVIPKAYVSTAVLRISDVDQLAKAEQNVLTRKSLSQIIQDPALQLYPSERSTQPLEDVIENMRRRDIHINVLNEKDQSAAIKISFMYADKKKAQAVVRILIAKLSQALEPGQSRQNLEILDPPNLPAFAASPKRPEMLIEGITAGLLLGLLAAVFVKHPRRSLVFATLGLVGGLIGGASSFLIPNRYVSRAVIRVAPYDKNFEQALNQARPPGLGVRVIPLHTNAVALQLTFEDTDPARAQAAVKSTITSLMSGQIASAVESQGTVHVPSLEVLDNANLPQSPSYPNRIVISLLGLCAGFIVALTTLLLQRRTLKSA